MMNIERKNLLIILAIFLFVFISVPSVIFNQAIKRYLNFLGLWAEKPLNSTKPIYINQLPPIHKRTASIGDLKQPELKFITFSIQINSAKEVFLAGDFNKWNKNSIKLVKKDKNKWETIIPLPPGSYRYVYYVDGKKTLDPLNSKTDKYENEEVSLLKVE